MSNSKKISVKVNYLYSLSYQILLIIMPFITTPYISRALGAEAIGIYSFTYAQLTYFILVGVLGLSTYSQLQVAKLRDNAEALSQFCVEVIALRVITMGLSILLFIFVVAINSVDKYIYLAHLTVLVANGIDITWLFQGLEDFKTVTIRNFIVKILTVIAIFLFVKTEKDLILYALLMGGGTLLGNMSVVPFLRRYVHVSLCKRLNLNRHIKATIIYFLPSIASVLITTVDKMMLGFYFPDKIQNGYYEQASKIELMIFTLFSSLNLTMRSHMAYLSAQGKKDEIKGKMMISVQFVVLLAVPISFGLFGISRNFVPWFFGAGYSYVVNLLKVFAAWITFKAISNCILEQYIIPNDGQVWATKMVWCAAFLNVILNVALIPQHGAVGAAMASVICEFFILYMVVKKSKRVLDFRSLWEILWKKIISAAGMVVLLLVTEKYFAPNIIGTCCQVMLGCIVYFLVIICLRDTFVTNVLREVVNRIRRKR